MIKMIYIAEIENSKIINEFKKAVKKTGKSESDVLVQLMAKFVEKNKIEKNSMDILFDKMEENKDVFIRMRDK
ncbi:UDP-glucose 4-epimerase [Leptotrichia massiliensis]|uniref:UDP-glucose 4-epimerase n=1 Tax=Leptotrichia massiliensis TaxID=1852388 RepID=UPI0028D839BA|nr:UDP-glucose 4-epimerase [Leptotrichia massiliensis]